ncbi:ATPase, T2SS/T4P/T4SS family [Streptomyces sp. KLOTTS4A1]|uniref:CpaF family protein n=1 Tax=Streptomyces sp. KLOTTS4A1 TaxID=3390996 RepID=UPI0039F622FF
MADTPHYNGNAPGGQGRTKLGAMLNRHQAAQPPPPRVMPSTAPAHPVPAQSQPAAPTPVPGPAGPADFAAAVELPGALPVERSVIQDLRLEVAEDLRRERARRGGAGFMPQEEEQLADVFAQRRVAAWHATKLNEKEPLTREQLDLVRVEILNLTFRAGVLQQILDRPGVQNIDIDLHQKVMFVDDTGRPRQRLSCPFDDAQQALEWVNTMAQQSGHGERQLAPASPFVRFRLPDNSRVAATLMASNIVISIRKHGGANWRLTDLERLGTIDPLMREFLAAAVRARLSIIAMGDMTAGKTTLVRCLAREIPAEERLITLETEFELFLDTDQTLAHTVAFEERESNGEDGAGQLTIADMLPEVLRYNADRVLVGEVRGQEAEAMMEAMSMGMEGSMCTMHAKKPEEFVGRLVLRLAKAGLDERSSHRLIASAVDLMVFIERRPNGAKAVTHIWEVDGLGEGHTVVTNPLFALNKETGRTVPTLYPMTPDRAERIAAAGFDPLLRARYPQGAWPPADRQAS